MDNDDISRFGTITYVRLATEHARVVLEFHNELEAAFQVIEGQRAEIDELKKRIESYENPTST